MKDLCTRSRAAANVLLLFVLLQGWVYFTGKETAEGIARDVNDIAEMLTEHAQGEESPAVKTLDGEYQSALKTSKSLGAQTISLETILKLSRDDVMTVRPTENEMGVFRQRASESFRDVPFLDEKSSAGRQKSLEIARMRRDDPLFDFKREQLDLAVKLQHIQDLILEAQLPEKSNVLDLGRKFSREFEAPFIKQPLERDTAAVVLSLVNIGPLALLFVLMDSIWILVREWTEREDDPEPEPLDWIMFYRSKWGFILGVAWLAAPVAMLVATIVSSEDASYQRSLFFTIVFVMTTILAGMSVWRARQIRRAYV